MSDALDADPEVRQAIDRLHGSVMEERRRSRREPFPLVQRIAHAAGRKVPEQEAFFPIRCRDLSTRGFSFIVEGRPQFKSLVLALGSPPDVLYIAAEVRHCTDVLVEPSGRVEVSHTKEAQADCPGPGNRGARPGVLVGCEFVQRLEA